MVTVSTIGLDLAKNVFQAHGVDANGTVVFRKKLRRDQVLRFFAGQPACIVAMEACASAHYWAREIAKLGHTTRLIAAHYVKPFIKRQKNDAADAEAICEAAQRPTMRFVTVKSEEKQGSAVVFRTRDLLVRQRTQIINALRGHLAEYGNVTRHGPAHVAKLIADVQDSRCDLLEAERAILEILVETLQALEAKLKHPRCRDRKTAKQDNLARRLMTIPGVGAVVATAVEALAPPMEVFSAGATLPRG
jgi:transposase